MKPYKCLIFFTETRVVVTVVYTHSKPLFLQMPLPFAECEILVAEREFFLRKLLHYNSFYCCLRCVVFWGVWYSSKALILSVEDQVLAEMIEKEEVVHAAALKEALDLVLKRPTHTSVSFFFVHKIAWTLFTVYHWFLYCDFAIFLVVLKENNTGLADVFWMLFCCFWSWEFQALFCFWEIFSVLVWICIVFNFIYYYIWLNFSFAGKRANWIGVIQIDLQESRSNCKRTGFP